ncbi:hypothetical protein [Pontibacter russatus]|uniref:hypothetical protein n=1 Tax=Pontibacter russatus TaxID=2694929 RepID=UPI00137A681D|nr:hypothetical protein [Pontibacter russatus]
MKRLAFLLQFVLLVCLPLLSCAQLAPRQAEVFTPEQLREDFSLFRRALEEAHPGLYRYTPKEVFDAEFDSTFAALNKPMTEQEFYASLKPLVTFIRCGHTKLIPKGAPDGAYNYWYHTDQLFPLKLYVTAGKAHILYHYADGGRLLLARSCWL